MDDERAAPDPPDETGSIRHFLNPLRWRPFFSDVDREIWVICIVAAVGLTLQELVFRAPLWSRFAPHVMPEALAQYVSESKPFWKSLMREVWWVGGGVTSWIILPMLAIRFIIKRPLSDFGLRWLGWRKLVPYIALLLAFFPVVLFAAFWLPGFKDSYPLYRGLWLWKTFLIFELLYGLQFLAVEFFFRGFLVNGLGRSLGYKAILVAMLPYVMIHFHKPFLEANAAIIAGVVLGAFALRTRSIWGGLLLHLGVAWGMDILALMAGSRGGFPKAW